MGGDHWKSLANKLGAPGVDAPTVETTPEPARSLTPVQAEKPVAIPVAIPVAVPTPMPISAPASGARRHDTAQAPARPSMPETPPAPAPSARTEKPTKRKSSWDTLTSFFGISSAPEAPAAEISSAAPAETDALEMPTSRRGGRESTRPPRGYESKSRHESTRAAEPTRAQEPRAQERTSEPRSQEPKASALDTLFGEAPRQPLSWEKPTPRRMVDDVSGWDDEEPAEAFVEAESDEPQVPSLRGEEADADAEAPQRRRRRRRRGGSRREREEGTGPQAGRGDARHAGPASRGERAELPEPVESVESAERWAEPEAFESEVEGSEDVVPERRSTRRRRRGRGRDRIEEGAPEVRSTREPAEARAPREPRPTREPRAPRELEGREPREPREGRETREPRPAREPRVVDEEGTVAPERPRREPRQRPPRVAEAPRRELSAVSDDLDDEVDSSLAAELEEGGPNRHPKIPTWADSLEAIISANMDNHRRGEGQRGGAPRGGRPRGGAPRR